MFHAMQLRNRTVPNAESTGSRDPTNPGGGSARKPDQAAEEGATGRRDMRTLGQILGSDPEPNLASDNRLRRELRLQGASVDEIAEEVEDARNHMATEVNNMRNLLATSLTALTNHVYTEENRNNSANTRAGRNRSVRPGASSTSERPDEHSEGTSASSSIPPSSSQSSTSSAQTRYALPSQAGDGMPENRRHPSDGLRTAANDPAVLQDMIANAGDAEVKRLLTDILVETRVAARLAPVNANNNSVTARSFKCKPNFFDGTTSWYHYVTHIEAVAEANDWPRHSWAQYMRPYLQGTAQDWYKDLDQARIQDWSYVVKTMGEKLGETPQVCQNKATSMQFSYDSDLVKGCAELSTLIAGGFPNMSITDKNELVKSHFARALPPDLKREVAPFVISSPNMSVSELARYAEIMRKNYYARQSVGQVSRTTPVRPAPQFDVTCFGCGDKGHFKSNCPKQQRRPGTQQPSSNPRTPRRNNGNGNGNNRSPRNAPRTSDGGNPRLSQDRRGRNQSSRGSNDSRNGGNRRQTSQSSVNRNAQQGGWGTPSAYPPMVPVQYVSMPAYSPASMPAPAPVPVQSTAPTVQPAPAAAARVQTAPAPQQHNQGE